MCKQANKRNFYSFYLSDKKRKYLHIAIIRNKQHLPEILVLSKSALTACFE